MFSGGLYRPFLGEPGLPCCLAFCRRINVPGTSRQIEDNPAVTIAEGAV